MKELANYYTLTVELDFDVWVAIRECQKRSQLRIVQVLNTLVLDAPINVQCRHAGVGDKAKELFLERDGYIKLCEMHLERIESGEKCKREDLLRGILHWGYDTGEI